MTLYANVIPRQLSRIPWPWKNETRDGKTFVVESPGEITMPSLVEYFDWNTYIVEDKQSNRLFGTRNFKSLFTTAARFLGYEKLLIEKPNLYAILDGFLSWNEALLNVWREHLEYFHLADDIAGNMGLMLSPNDFRSWLLPYYREFVDWAKAYRLTVIFHSDGDIREVLDDLNDIGVDYLDYQPVGKMLLLQGITYKRMHLILNEEDEQRRTNEETMRLQR